MQSVLASPTKPERQKCHEEGEFFVFEVPVFKVHTRSIPLDPNDPDSERVKVKFTARDMERIAERNNQRIHDTGSYSTVVIRHNPTREQRQAGDTDRPVVGFMGPYWTGDFGNVNPVRAIFAQVRIHKSKKAESDFYPKHSVEYWPENNDPNHPDYRVGDFDPLALLGSEPPELDLGLRYSRQRDGKNSINYQLEQATTSTTASPAGSNTFVPGTATKKRRDQYSAGKESKPMATDLDDLDTAEAGKADAGNDAGKDDTAAVPADSGQMLSAESIKQIGEIVGDITRSMIEEETTKSQAIIRMICDKIGLDPDATDIQKDDPSNPGGEEAAAAPALNAAADPAAAMPAQAADPNAAGPVTNAASPANAGDESGDDPNNEPADDEDDAEQYGADGLPMSAGDDDRDGEDEESPSARMAGPSKYQRENQKLKSRVAELERAAETRDMTERTQSRYQRLIEIQGKGYLIEPAEEIKEFKDADDAQFDRHCVRIEQKYARGTTSLPGVREAAQKASKYSRLNESQKTEISNKAKSRFQEIQKKSPRAEYIATLKNVCNEEGIELDL